MWSFSCHSKLHNLQQRLAAIPHAKTKVCFKHKENIPHGFTDLILPNSTLILWNALHFCPLIPYTQVCGCVCVCVVNLSSQRTCSCGWNIRWVIALMKETFSSRPLERGMRPSQICQTQHKSKINSQGTMSHPLLYSFRCNMFSNVLSPVLKRSLEHLHEECLWPLTCRGGVSKTQLILHSLTSDTCMCKMKTWQTVHLPLKILLHY